MDDLPAFMQDLPEDVEVQPAEFRHNWMYAMIPADGPYQHIYLAGYCKYCQQAVTVLLPSHSIDNGVPTLTQLNIPRWGCVDPTSL